MNTHTKKSVIRKYGAFAGTAMIAAATGALALASPASAGIHDKYIAVDCPRPYSQECNAEGVMDVRANGDVFITFAADPGGCADIIGHFFVNGVEFASQQISPGQNDVGVYINESDIPAWPDGRYHIAMRADGVPGGCNTGEMSGWAGHLHAQTGPDA